MLIHHKFVDVLRGISTERPLRLYGSANEARARVIAGIIEKAEKFDFGVLHLEPGIDTNYFELPPLTKDELEAWNENLVPLPAPLCWYEFTVDSCRCGLIIVECDDEWTIQRLDFSPAGLVFNDSGSVIKRGRLGVNCGVEIFGEAARVVLEKNYKTAAELYGSIPIMSIYLSLMLISRSTEIVRERAPEKLNKSRIAKGKASLADHTIVRILPKEYLRQRLAESGRTHASPRLHWRRSHLRTLHRGTQEERKIIIQRHLISKASQAEISHEYRIG